MLRGPISVTIRMNFSVLRCLTNRRMTVFCLHTNIQENIIPKLLVFSLKFQKFSRKQRDGGRCFLSKIHWNIFGIKVTGNRISQWKICRLTVIFFCCEIYNVDQIERINAMMLYYSFISIFLVDLLSFESAGMKNLKDNSWINPLMNIFCPNRFHKMLAMSFGW